MITVDRLFHIDLTHFWNRAASRFEALPPAKFNELFTKPAELFAANPVALIAPRVLFPNDADYLADVVRRHGASALFVTLVINHEDEKDEDAPEEQEREVSQKRHTLLLNAAALSAIRDLLPQRLPCDIPLLAEVEIFLDGPHIE